MFSWEIINFMMLVNSSVGTFEYMLSVSKEASLVFLSKEISVKSSINCIEFLTLNTFGSGIYSCRSLDSNLAILYAGAFYQLIMGLMGELVLCILGRPFILGADGLRFVYFHFSSLWIVTVQLLIIFRISFSTTQYRNDILYGKKRQTIILASWTLQCKKVQKTFPSAYTESPPRQVP